MEACHTLLLKKWITVGKCEELTPSTVTAAVQVALRKAFGFIFGADNRRRLCLIPEMHVKLKQGIGAKESWYTHTYTRAISNRQDLGLRLTMWRTVMHCQSAPSALWLEEQKSPQWAGWWLIMPDNNVSNASRLLNLTKQSVWVWAAAIPKLLSTSTERCKTTKCNTSLMLWLLMFSRHWSTVYPRHPSQAPTCLFAFSLHLYSLQMSSQGAACLSHQYHHYLHSGARVFAQIKQLYMSATVRSIAGMDQCRSRFVFAVKIKGLKMKKKRKETGHFN